MPGRIAIKLIRFYQCTLSLLIGNQCRFYPSCSHYTQEAIANHGLGKGCYYGLRRILRCHPWHPGGLDPVPGPGQGQVKTITPSSKSPTQ